MPSPTPRSDAFLSAHPHYFMYQGNSDINIPAGNYEIMDGLNDCRSARVAEVLSDFRTLLFYITSGPTQPENPIDYFSFGWRTLRQCARDCQHILACPLDQLVPVAEGELEQVKVELNHVLLDAFSRRHEATKIFWRQGAGQRHEAARRKVLELARAERLPYLAAQALLQFCDDQLRKDISTYTDEAVYDELAAADLGRGRWTVEDPSLDSIVSWLRERPRPGF
ncbi:hypothetical protein E4U42_000328 [Claviceps africana]|uniref:Uncharacterized protein n=1 Tax=Claviceps africana TaxID=83212 RepID=A0A8K0JG95_9HYPO|nr:hypothetical protein E4U42_000328 [Claviceps africana]